MGLYNRVKGKKPKEEETKKNTKKSKVKKDQKSKMINPLTQ